MTKDKNWFFFYLFIFRNEFPFKWQLRTLFRVCIIKSHDSDGYYLSIFFLCRLMWFQVIRYRIYFKQSSMKFIFLSSVVIWIKFCRCYLIYTKTFRLMKYCTVKQILDNFKLIENLFLIHCIILVQNNAVYKPQKHTLWFDLHRFKCNLYERFLLAQKLM